MLLNLVYFRVEIEPKVKGRYQEVGNLSNTTKITMYTSKSYPQINFPYAAQPNPADYYSGTVYSPLF